MRKLIVIASVLGAFVVGTVASAAGTQEQPRTIPTKAAVRRMKNVKSSQAPKPISKPTTTQK